MIYYMTTKTLVEQYVKELGPDNVLATNFLVISTRIYGSFRTEETLNRLNWNNATLFGLVDDAEDKNISFVTKKLSEEINDLKLIIEMVRRSLVEPNNLNVILTDPKSHRTMYPKTVAMAIHEMFDYPVIDYKHREREYTYEPKRTAELLSYWTAVHNRNVLRWDPDKLKDVSKKARKKLLKTLGLYEKGMDKKEMGDLIMDDTASTFLQNIDHLFEDE